MMRVTHFAADNSVQRFAAAVQSARISEWIIGDESQADTAIDSSLFILSVLWVIVVLGLLLDATRRYW